MRAGQINPSAETLCAAKTEKNSFKNKTKESNKIKSHWNRRERDRKRQILSGRGWEEIMEKKSFERDMINWSLITQFRRCFLQPQAAHIPWRRNGPSRLAVRRGSKYKIAGDFPKFSSITHLFTLFLCERITLFMLHVLLEIEECVEENRRHFAAF